MEKSKINSQDLIEKSGGGDLIFHTATPAKVVFDLQRFAEINISQSGGKTDMSASDKISSALYAYTLGRSSSKESSKSAGETVAYTGSDKIQFAPVGTAANSAYGTYGLKVYSAGENQYRMVLDGTASTAAAETKIGEYTLSQGTAYAGIAINNDYTATANFASSYTASAKEFTGSEVTAAYSNSEFTSDGTYKGLWFEVSGNNSKIGTAIDAAVVTGSGSQTYSLDFYDVKDTDGYHVKGLAASKEILAASANTYTFGGITSGETEAYNLNGVAVSATAIVDSAPDYTAKVEVNTFSTADNYVPEFTISTVNSNTELTFAFNEQTAIKIGEISYTASTNQGTLAFTKLAGTTNIDAITLGDKAKFTNVFTGGASTAYGLESYASGTFTTGSNGLFLDIDGFGTAGTAYDIMSFTGTANVFAIAGNSDVTIQNGSVTATGTDVYNLGYVLSDTTNGVGLTIGNLTFTDAKNDHSNTFISFADNGSSTIKFNGTFTVAVKNGQTYGISDTNGATLSMIQFGADSNTLTIGSGVAIGGTFKNVILSQVGSDTIKNGSQAYTFAVSGDYEEAKNTATFFNSTKIDTSGSHVFSPAVTSADGVTFGDNLSLGSSTLTVSANKAQVYGDFFFGASGNGDTASGTVVYKAASDITLTGGTLDISGFESGKLVGVSSATFTVNSTGANFFIKDDAKALKIGDITFSEVDDGSITKLAYTTTSSEMAIFGNLSVTAGSGTKMNYLLGSSTSVYHTNSIALGGLTFIGSGTTAADVSVGVDTAGTFKLTAGKSNKAANIEVSGTSTAATTYALQANSSGTFKFGIVSIGVSDTGLTSVYTVTGIDNELGDASSATFAINGGNFSIADAEDSASFKVSALSGGLFAISQIDSGATLYSVASTTKVITNGSGIFTFSGTYKTATGEGLRAEQVFEISGDANGVTFNLNSATGLVTSIEGISTGAKVKVTDWTARNTKNTWEWNSKKIGFTANSWTAVSNGTWGPVYTYLGYMVNPSDTTLDKGFAVTGINSATSYPHILVDENVGEIGTSSSGKFVLAATAFDGTATSVFFTNKSNGPGYGADSGTTSLFTNLTAGSTATGVLFAQKSNTYLQLATIGTTGTATSVSKLADINNGTLSMTLGALPVYAAGEGYQVSGTGVAFTVTKDMATVDGDGAYIRMDDPTAVIGFGSNTGVASVHSNSTLRHAFTFDASGATGALAATGTNSSIFAINVLPGVLVSDTLTKTAENGESSLTVNNITFGVAGGDSASGTLVFKAGESGASTSTFAAGTFTIDSYDNATNTTLGFANGAGLLFTGYSYTGKAATTSFMTLGGDSASQVASVSSGTVTAQLADNKTFAFWLNGASSTFTASPGGVTYDLLGTTAKNAMVGGSATGILKSVGQHSIAVLSDTFMMQSGSKVVLTYGDTYQAQSATTVYSDGKGSQTYAAGTTFSLNDFYFSSATGRGGAAYNATPYVYTASGTAGVSLSLNWYDGTETVKITAGQATRSTNTTINDTFTFNDNTYSATGNAITFMIDSSISKAKGTFYAGAGSRSYTGGTATNLAAISFNSDTYTYFNDAIVGLNVVAGKGTETFVSGSATFMAASGKVFHFDINGSETGGVNAYSATKTLYLNAGGFSVSESNTTVKTIGQLYSIMDGSGTSAAAITGIIGTRLSTAAETHTFLADSYTVAAEATLGLNILNESLGASETVTLGTATYVAGTGGVFHIDKTWAAGSSTKLTDFVGANTYSYTAVNGATLNMYIDGASYTQKIASGYGIRQQNSDTFKFTIGGTENTYSSTSGALTFRINSDSKTAEGSFYGGVGSRLYNGGTSTTLAALTLAGNSYTTFVDATLQVEVEELAIKGGSETFVSGSATFTAAASSNDTFYAIASGTSNPVQYTAIEDVAISAGFSNSATGVVYAASGKGTRTFDGTENFTFTLAALSDTFTMTAGKATITLSNTTLTASNNAAYGIAEATSGTGVMYLNPTAGIGSSTTFALSDKYFNGGTDATPYVYTASTTGTLTLNMQSADSQTITMLSGLVGWRSSGTSGTEFVFDPDGDGDIPEQTYYLQGAATYTVDSTAASASGKVFAAVATRSYDFATQGTNTTAQNISFRGDEYTASQGILTLNIVNGKAQSETFTSGSATYTVPVTNGFLFNINDFTTTDTTKLNSYSATSQVVLTIGVNASGSATGIVNATGSGTRVLSAGNTYAQAFDALGGNTYTFADGTVGLTMNGTTATESIDSGTGTFTPGASATAIVRFDKDGNFTGNAYSYTSFADATFTIGYASGTIKTQSITGTATRSNQSDATFVYGGKTYSSTSKSDSTSAAGQLAFVLDSTNAATYGAQGIFTEGFGFRVQDGAVNYSDTKYAKANVYSITDAEFKLSSSNSTISESLYHGSGSNTFTNNTAFYYLGTEYTASGTAKMNLNAVSGVVSETLTEGVGIFDSSDSSVTFEYGGNMYHVSGTAKLSITSEDPEPKFESGTGVKELVKGVAGSNTFVYTDQNTYTLTSDKGTLMAQAPNSATAVVRFLDASATAEDKIAESKTFYFDPANIEGTETKLYTAFGGDVVLKLQGVADINASANVPEFDSGSATRVDNTVKTFEFDGITYTSTATADAGITFMLTAESNSETTYAGTGSRGIENSASFTFLSPLTGNMASYTATAPVTFRMTVTAGVGSETFVSGSGTRTLEAGTAFTFEVDEETRNYTVSGTGITTLTPKASGNNGLLGLTGYDPSSAQEILTDVNANRTESTTFVYKSVVTNSDTTYTANGNVIINDVFKDDSIVEGSSTWVSGTGTMTLAASTEFTYYLNGTDSHTYKAAADGAGFTRVSQTAEYLTSGYGTRDAVAGDVANFTYTFLADTYTAAAGGSIALSGTGLLEATDAKETYSAGSATFTALAADSGQFHFVVDGTTNTYTASSDVTFTAEVKNGTPDYANIVATGA